MWINVFSADGEQLDSYEVLSSEDQAFEEFNSECEYHDGTGEVVVQLVDAQGDVLSERVV